MDTNRQTIIGDDPKIERDEQSGKPFEIQREGPLGALMACVSAIYLLCALAFLLWLLFDTWSGRNFILDRFGYSKETLTSNAFRLMAFVAIGGAMGGTVNGIRSVISWHSERRAYGPRFIWKDLSLPLTGAAVGLFVYVSVRGGVGILNGDFTFDQKGSAPAVGAFAVASLAGFSSQQVFHWLDAQANKIFLGVKGAWTVVPSLKGKTFDEAEAALKTSKLTLGPKAEVADSANIGKILKQSPGPGSVVSEGEPVAVTVGAKTA